MNVASRSLSRVLAAAGLAPGTAAAPGRGGLGLASGVATLALGVFVVVAWHGRTANVLDPQTWLAPMPYNSGLAFALCGLSLTLLGLARWRAAGWSAMAAGLLGAAAWVHELTGWESGIGRLLFSAVVRDAPYAFDMAPVTALGFLLAALSLWLLACTKPSDRRVAASGFLANVLFALGVVPVLGYLGNVDAAYAWRDMTRISGLSAVGFTLLAPGMFVMAVVRGPDRPDGLRWLPAAAAVGLSTLAAVLWLALHIEQREGLEQSVAVETQVAGEDVEVALSERIEALQRMARRWEVRGGTPREEWQDDARLFAAHLEGVAGVAFVDVDGRVRRLASERGSAPLRSLERQARARTPADGVWVTAESGSPEASFSLHVPLLAKGQVEGSVTALHHAAEFFDIVLGPRTRERLQIAVFDGAGEQLYGPPRFDVASPRFNAAHQLSVAGDRWRLVAAPTSAFVAQRESWLPTVVLVTGLVLASLVAACIHLLQLAERRKTQLVAANLGLEEGISARTAELERAQRNLKRAYDDERLGLRRLQSLLDSLAEAIYAVDKNGNCLYCNIACMRMLGYQRRRELIGRNMHDLIHHTRRDGAPYHREDCPVDQGLRTGTGSHADNELLWRADGTSFAAEYWSLPILDQEGDLLAGVVTFFDISERQRSREELERRHRQQAAVARLGMTALRGGHETLMQEAARVAAEALDVEFAKVLELMPPGEHMRLLAGVGWKPGLVGEALVDTGPNSQAGYTLSVNEPVIVTDLTRETRFLGPELLLKHGVVSGMSTIIHGRAGPWGVLGVHTARHHRFDDADVAFLQGVANLIGYALQGAQAADEIRLLNDELEHRVERRTAELEAANRELEGFSYSVSHDLRSPLRAIDGFADVLLEDHGERLSGEGRRVLGVIQRNVAKMGRLIDELLQFSRLSRRELDRLRIDMTALAREIVDETLEHERDRRFDVCIDPLPDASGDPLLLRQVWVNLIDNAVKYTRGRDPASIRITGATDGHWLTYSVADDGVGFDMAYADKLFGVFQRLHRESEFAGTGVGLALVQRIVARHEGQIHGHGTPGAGATFTFRLPKEQNS